MIYSNFRRSLNFEFDEDRIDIFRISFILFEISIQYLSYSIRSRDFSYIRFIYAREIRSNK